MRYPIFSLLLLCSITVLGQKDSNFEEIPPELGKDKSILLVQDVDKNAVSKALYDAFEKFYKGAYEIQPQTIVYSKKYLDVVKYRYLFTVFTKEVPGYWIGRERFPPTTDYSYGVLDRYTGKQYKLDGWAGGFKRSMNDYVKSLEKTRAANSN